MIMADTGALALSAQAFEKQAGEALEAGNEKEADRLTKLAIETRAELNAANGQPLPASDYNKGRVA
jgi:hypothetical protein